MQGSSQLPDLAADQRHVVQLHVPVTQTGQVHLSARLQYCTTQVMHFTGDAQNHCCIV